MSGAVGAWRARPRAASVLAARSRPLSAPAPCASPALPQVTIFKKAGLTKFKIRCSKYLYTLCMRDADKVRALARRSLALLLRERGRSSALARARPLFSACARAGALCDVCAAEVAYAAGLLAGQVSERRRLFPSFRPRAQAKKLEQSLPPGLQKQELPAKRA